MGKTVLSNNIIGKEYPSIAYKVSKRRLIAFAKATEEVNPIYYDCLLYTSPSPRD